MNGMSHILAELFVSVLGFAVLSSGSSSDDEGTNGSGLPRRRRHASDLKNLPRSAALSHLYRSAEAVAEPNRPPVSMYSPSALWEWARRYLAYVFRKQYPFPTYSSARPAVYELIADDGGENVRVAVAGDWGTGTDEADAVASRMMEFQPHFTVHLGDVYYVGDPPEVNENCLGIRNPSNNYAPLTWPVGTRGSFALNGNHEMYANGVGYFVLFLPRLGLRSRAGVMQGQDTSFFCLQNSHWRIIAIDTGYYSTGVPILSHIPLVNRIPGIGGNCRLPDNLMQWLVEIVRPDQDKRGLVIMSHHQYCSGFQEDYRKPAQQLWEAGVRRPVVWFWGHEHRLAGYDLVGADDLKCFGRCIGHGGMPIDVGDPKHDPQPVFWDDRLATNGYGVNGHVNLSFAGPTLTAEYVDLNKNRLLEEQWSVNDQGVVRLESRKRITDDPKFHVTQRPAR
jgi:hypothetical protein